MTRRWKCAKCGHRARDDEMACPNCGQSVHASQWEKAKKYGQSRIKCPHCQGRGFVIPPDHTAFLDQCPVCQGHRCLTIPTHQVQQIKQRRYSELEKARHIS